MNPALHAYAEQVLSGTGLRPEDLPLAADRCAGSAAAQALSAGWRCAAAPVPELPIEAYDEEDRP